MWKPPLIHIRISRGCLKNSLFQVLGIYEVRDDRINYYDSLEQPDAYTSAITERFLKETVKQLKVKYNLVSRETLYVRHANDTYEKQSDGTSCGFFVCYYVEAFLTLRQSSGFFMDDAMFTRSYRRQLLDLLVSVAHREFPAYIPLTGFAVEPSRGRTITRLSYEATLSAPGADNRRKPTLFG